MPAFLNKQRLLVVTAAIGALGAGMALGFLLGVPGLSSAEPAPAASRLPGPRVVPGLAIPSLAIAAKTIGVSATVLAQDLRSGQSIAEVARSKNVAVQKVIDALTTAATARIETALKNGRITDAQATALQADLASRIPAFVNQTGLPFRFRGVTGTAVPHGRFRPPTSTAVPFPGPLGRLGVRSIGAAAKAIGVSPTVVVQALRAGQSIADVARSHNVSPQSVVTTLTTDASNRIDAAANAGKITPVQAASLKAHLSSEVTTFVNQKGLSGIVPGAFGRFGGKAPGGGPGPGPVVPPRSQL